MRSSTAIKIRSIFRVALFLILSLSVNISAQEKSKIVEDFKLADFQNLNWFVGKWHGTGGGESFFEAYTLENDSTMKITYYTDSTFTESSGFGSFYYKNGSMYHSYNNRGLWGVKTPPWEK